MEILGSGKCKYLNKNEKEILRMALFRATQIFTDRMREEKEEKEAYKEHISEFQKVTRKCQKYFSM